MLLRHSLALELEAAEVARAVEAALADGARTADLGGEHPLTTAQMGEAIVSRLDGGNPSHPAS